MRRQQGSDQRFEDLLEGRSSTASVDMERMAKLARALAPSEVPGPSERFRRRLRSELLAQAATTPEDLFAALLDGAPVEAPVEIQQLVTVASALEPATLPSPDPAFRFQLRGELVRQAAVPEVTSFRSWFAGLNERLRRSTRFAGALAAAVVMMLGSSVALAAAHSTIPGDTLYSLKTLHETVRLLVASGEAEGHLRLDLARERLREVQALAERGDVREDLYISTLRAMDGMALAGTDILLAEFERTSTPDTLDVLERFNHDLTTGLEAVIDKLPAGARPAALDSLRLVRRSGRQIEALRGCECLDDALIGAPAGSPTDRGATCTCELITPAPAGDPNAPPQNQEPTRRPPSVDEPVDEPVVDLPDGLPDQVEDPVEDLVDGIIEGVEETLPPLPEAPVPTNLVPSI